MKRVSILIIFLLSLSIVSAVNFDDFEESYNVGDILTISGNADGSSTSIDLTLICDDDEVDMWDASVEEGLFSKEIELDNDMIGTCYVTGETNGEDSNSGVFEVVDEASVEEPVAEVTTNEVIASAAPVITNTIGLTANLNKNIYRPGDKLTVSGAVDKQHADVIVEVDGKQLVVSDKTNFNVDYILPKDMKGGQHSLLVKAKDDSNGYGEIALNYMVDIVPTRIDLQVGKNYNPGEYIGVTVNLYDQSELLISGVYNIKIYEGLKKILDEEHTLNELSNLKLPDFAKPGIRKIDVSAFGLNSNAEFSVNELKKLDISLSGDSLTIRNVGNVDFDEDLVIVGDGITNSKRLFLGLNEYTELDLSNLFSQGIYKIEVPLTGQTFENVQVDKAGIISNLGNGLTSMTGLTVYSVKKTYSKYGEYIIGVLVLLVVAMIVLNIRTKFKKVEGAKAREYMDGQRRLKELQAMPRRSERYDYRKASSEDIEYFKTNVINSYNETEKQDHQNKVYNKPNYYSQYRAEQSKPKNEPPSNSGGLFSMFK